MGSVARALIYLPVGAFACIGTSDTGDDDEPVDTDIVDTDVTDMPDTDTDTDTPGVPGTAVKVLVGDAIVEEGVSYTGTELRLVVGDYGDGATTCVITTTMTSVAVRDDCPTCEWAFDVVTSDATVATDFAGACMGVFGVDASTVSSLDGVVVGYGYVAEYIGHAPVLMIDLGSVWAAANYATYDPKTGVFQYEWDDGPYTY